MEMAEPVGRPLEDDMPMPATRQQQRPATQPVQAEGSAQEEAGHADLDAQLVQDAATERQVIISCENIHKTYLLGVEGVAALRGVSVDVHRGELIAVYGISGGGKSTLLNVLGTIDTPTKGNLRVFSERVTDRTPDSALANLRLRKLGFVFQSFNLLSTMTAEENVSLPMVLAGDLSRADIKKRARQLLTDVGLGHRMDHVPAQLSGGEQQRVTIARALANDPELLLLDEPTGDLDTKNSELIMDILLRLNESRTLTMVLVTHDTNLKAFAHRVLHLRDGKVAAIVETEERKRMEAVLALRKSAATKWSPAENETAGSAPVRPESIVRRPQDYRTYVSPEVVARNEQKSGGKKNGVRHHLEDVELFRVLFGADALRARPLLQEPGHHQAAEDL